MDLRAQGHYKYRSTAETLETLYAFSGVQAHATHRDEGTMRYYAGSPVDYDEAVAQLAYLVKEEL